MEEVLGELSGESISARKLDSRAAVYSEAQDKRNTHKAIKAAT